MQISEVQIQQLRDDHAVRKAGDYSAYRESKNGLPLWLALVDAALDPFSDWKANRFTSREASERALGLTILHFERVSKKMSKEERFDLRFDRRAWTTQLGQPRSGGGEVEEARGSDRAALPTPLWEVIEVARRNMDKLQSERVHDFQKFLETDDYMGFAQDHLDSYRAKHDPAYQRKPLRWDFTGLAVNADEASFIGWMERFSTVGLQEAMLNDDFRLTRSEAHSMRAALNREYRTQALQVHPDKVREIAKAQDPQWKANAEAQFAALKKMKTDLEHWIEGKTEQEW